MASVLLLALVQEPPLQGPSPWTIADNDLSSLVVGEFSGDTHLDAVVLANGEPVLRESIETQQTYISAELTAVDIARLPGTGAGGRDQLVAVGLSGLSLLEFQDVVSPPWSITPVSDGTHWKNALAVRVGQVDGLHGEDIVAVTATRVVIARSDGNGWWMTDVSFIAGIGIDGVELVDWDGASGGALEIAVIMAASGGLPARFRFFQPGGTGLGTIYSNSDKIIAAPLVATGIGTRYLAGVGTVLATGAQELVLLANGDMAGPWSLGEAGVHDIASGDWTRDGIDDVILSTTASPDAQLFVVVSDQPSQLSLDPLDTPPNPPVSLPVGHPARDPAVQDGGMAVADVDHDGDLDLVTAVQGDYAGDDYVWLDPRFSAVECTLNDAVDDFEYLPWPAPGTDWPEGLALPTRSLLEGDLTVELVTPEEVIEGAHYEYVVWHTPSIEELTDPTPLIGPLTAPIGAESTTLTLDLKEFRLFFPDLYTLIVRQVKLEGGAIVRESPALKVTIFSGLNETVLPSGWNVLVSGPLDFMDDPKPEESGGHSSGAPPPPPPPEP